LNLYRQGLALSQKGRFAGAVKLYQEAVRIDPELNGAYQALGYALYRLGRYEESAKASGEAARIATIVILIGWNSELCTYGLEVLNPPEPNTGY
jgi:tetratricopeptide (TPR) repeat protein